MKMIMEDMFGGGGGGQEIVKERAGTPGSLALFPHGSSAALDS